ncbi:MAG TPA: hypothetical protein VN894_11315 [Polyangiaceae bacterium]|nr:hypothetical protein [Polyangiaceae bacterium]
MISGFVTGDAEVLARFSALPGTMRKAVSDAVKREWFRVQIAVVKQKLSGDPLHRVTGVLASSINVGGAQTATSFDETETSITARIGTRVRYGAVHELGGTFQIPEHGRLGHMVRAHSATFPQRSFLRSTLAEMGPSIRENIARAVGNAIAASKG